MKDLNLTGSGFVEDQSGVAWVTVKDQKVTDTSYWLPADAERNDPTNWIESKSITDQLNLKKVSLP